jgi:hypothetical protein
LTKDLIMYMKKIIDRLGGIEGAVGDLTPMAEDEIVAFEGALGTRLPEDYRRFLAAYGASVFRGESEDNPYIEYRSLTPLPASYTDDDKGLFDVFYGTHRDDQDPFSLWVRTDFYAGRMPDSMIPIGDDGMGNQICLGVKGNEAGKIYFWQLGNEPLNEEQYLEDYGTARPPEEMFVNVSQIAESFDDFLSRLELRAE